MKKTIFTLVLLFAAAAMQAQTYVSGGIYSNTTWTKANSPYIVTDTVVVFPGVTLTIQPGVTVKFDDKIRLEVRGNLIAQGTVADSITFTSNSGSPTQGSWGNIYLNNSNNVFLFKYCKVIYSCGISGSKIDISNSVFLNSLGAIGSDSLILDSCLFNNVYNAVGASYLKANDCKFDYGNIGIFSYKVSIINKCTFQNYSYAGIRYNGTVIPQSKIYSEVKNSVFKNNYFGIKNGDEPPEHGIPIYMDSCIILKNQIGIYCNYLIFSMVGNVKNKITNCLIDSNNVYGIMSKDDYYDSIINCQITNNGTGIYSDRGANLVLMNIIENNRMGIHNNSGTSNIIMNIIENNNIGIQINENNYSGTNIFCNKICNNLTYDFIDSVAYGSNMNIKNNYWCTTDSATIASKIYDGYDNPNLGLVTFMPIDTSQCYLNGCALQVSATVTNATCDTCHNGSATAQVINGFPPYTYTWYSSPMQSAQTATGLAPGYYTLCVTDSKGCTACNSNIFIDSTNCTGFAVSAYSANATCSTCNDGKAWVNVSGGTPPYNYTWFTSPMQATDTAFALTQGTYNVCVTDVYGCTVCDSVTVAFGNCSAHFVLYPDTITPHHYFAVNMASGAAPLSYLWNWGDGSTGTGATPNHTYSNAGFYNICLTITDAAGCTDTYCNSFYLMKGENTIVSVDVILITGINENTEQSSFSIFPNPANEELRVEIQNPKFKDQNSKMGRYFIYSSFGQLIADGEIKSKETKINVSKLSKGLYLLKVESEEGAIMKKFIKE